MITLGFFRLLLENECIGHSLIIIHIKITSHFLFIYELFSFITELSFSKSVYIPLLFNCARLYCITVADFVIITR